VTAQLCYAQANHDIAVLLAGCCQFRHPVACDDYVNFIYCRLNLMTKVGFGDIYAVSPPARMLATFLAALGMRFPAIVIAQLAGLAASRR
jgi:hypothetical protein